MLKVSQKVFKLELRKNKCYETKEEGEIYFFLALYRWINKYVLLNDADTVGLITKSVTFGSPFCLTLL